MLSHYDEAHLTCDGEAHGRIRRAMHSYIRGLPAVASIETS